MDSKTFREVALSYAAVYNQDLREEMQDLGMISEARDGYGGDEKFNKPDDKIKRPGTDVPAPKKGGYGRISRATPYGIGAHANRTASRVTTIVGDDPGAPRAEKMARTTKMVKGKDGKWKKVNAESFDAYDIILMHLLDEGYAPNPDAAEAIMVNMSEKWREDILNLA